MLPKPCSLLVGLLGGLCCRQELTQAGGDAGGLDFEFLSEPFDGHVKALGDVGGDLAHSPNDKLNIYFDS